MPGHAAPIATAAPIPAPTAALPSAGSLAAIAVLPGQPSMVTTFQDMLALLAQSLPPSAAPSPQTPNMSPPAGPVASPRPGPDMAAAKGKPDKPALKIAAQNLGSADPQPLPPPQILPNVMPVLQQAPPLPAALATAPQAVTNPEHALTLSKISNAGPSTAIPTTPAAQPTVSTSSTHPQTNALPAMPQELPILPEPIGTATPTSISVATVTEPAKIASAIIPQITPALVQLAQDGAGTRMILQLNPHALGHITIAISTPPDSGPVQVSLTVERPETLALLRQDSIQLSHALDRAGIGSANSGEARNVSFHLSPPPNIAADAAPNAITPSAQTDTQHGSNLTSGFGQNAPDPRQYTSPRSFAFGVADDPVDEATTHVQPLRSGLNITA